MNVLVVGGGGREHALAWRLAKSPTVSRIFASPGNPGISEIATCFPAPADVAGYAALAHANDIGLTIVGPEAPLVAGIVNVFREQQLEIVGPTQAAAQLEGSKVFAKEFFNRAGIPTARSIQATTHPEARSALRHFSLPVVVKADGLAAGKGVVIAQTESEALNAIAHLGPMLVIEEYLEGEEVSFIGLSDGRRILPFAPSQDHKRIFDGDQGPNTGGMGAYCDSRILAAADTDRVMEDVMHRAIWQMRHEGSPFTGFLYAGLMMTADGPKVLEFNVRMGDPETQAILHAAEGDLLAFLRGDASALKWTRPSVCVVLAAKGYPEKPNVGDEIKGIRDSENAGATVFQAGTKLLEDNRLVTNGGRVLGITAAGDTLSQAIDGVYAAVRSLHFEGMQFRKDIGRKGLRHEPANSTD